MNFRRSTCAWVATAVLLTASCSSSGGKSSTATTAKSTGSAVQTYTLGVLADRTGAASAGTQDLTKAIDAGVGLAHQQGYNIRYVVADTESTPAGALAAAQTLVEQDHVFAVLAISDLAFAAASYLASKQIPVVGASIDGSEWNTNRNMFSIFGYADYSKVETTAGQFFKLVGATNLATLGYSIVPSSGLAAKAYGISAQLAGLQAGYINSQVPLGTTNTEPMALAMKNAHVDALAVLVQTSTGFAVINSLRQLGVALKAPALFAGYGSDLLDAGPAAINAAQNVYFEITFEPVEMHTPATEKFQNALKTYGHLTTVPNFNDYLAYTSVGALVTGLKVAGPNPTQASFIDAMLNVSNYNDDGLLGDHGLSFAMDQRGLGGSTGNCLWFTLFKGSTFHLVPGADPVCGTTVPGRTVSGS